MTALGRHNLINQLLFQLCYFACILGAAGGWLWPGVLAVGLMAAWQLSPVRRHPADLPLIALALFVGSILDSTWAASGLAAYSLPWPSADLAPAWILLLWMAFAMTINHSLAFLGRYPVLMVVLFAVGSPMSFYAGSRLGAVEWLAPGWIVVLCLALSWAIAVPLMYAFSRFWERACMARKLPEAAAAGVIDDQGN